MSTNPLTQGDSLRTDNFHLFETEIPLSRVLTFIKQVSVGAGLMILFFFWLSGYLVLDVNEFVLIRNGCADSCMPPITFGAELMISLNILAALIGAGVYMLRNSTGLDTSYGGNQESAATSTGRQAIKSNPLTSIRIAAPCTADWELMTGDDRVRFCDQCNRNVFNLSAMTRRQAESLILCTEGRLCARFYRRQDGTILTDDCPVGLRFLREKYRRLRTHTIGAALSFFSFIGIVGAGKLADSEQEPLREPYHGVEKVVEPPKSKEPKLPPLTPGAGVTYLEPVVGWSEEEIHRAAIFKATPRAGLPAGVSGDVVVRITVSHSGNFVSAQAISGPPPLRAFAEEAARRWKFAPLFLDGLPVKVESQLTFHFGQ